MNKVNPIDGFYNGIMFSIDQSVSEWGRILPLALLALSILLIGLMLGYLIEWLFMKLGEKLKLTHIWTKTGFDLLLERANIKTNPSHLVGKFVKGVVITYFLRIAAGILGFTEVEEFLQKIIALVPDIVIAVIILLFAISAANTAASLTNNLLRIGDKHARVIIASVVKNILIAFGIMAALVQLHVAEDLIRILFTALVAMLALAGGLALGLGGKDFVHELLADFKKKNIESHDKTSGHS